MRALRRTYWYISAYFRKHWKVVSIVTICSVLFSYFFLSYALSPARLRKTEYVGRIGTVTLATLPKDIQTKISVGLTQVDEQNTIKPGVAKDWQVSNDGKTYTFTLRDDLKWHDGKQLVPKDVQFSFSDVTLVTTEKQLSFQLKEPFAPFLSVVSQPLFRESNKGVLGLGEYKVRSIQREGVRIKELTLESLNEVIVYKFFSTEEQAIVAYKLGQVDSIEDLTTPGELQNWPRTQVQQQVQQDRYLAIFFNFTDPLIDKNVRQALNYALPKVKGELRMKGPLNPRSWAVNKTLKSYEQDMDNAVELLLRSVPQKPLVITLTTVTTFQNEAEEIRRYWQALGEKAAAECESNSKVTDKSLCPNLQIVVNLQVSNFPNVSTFQALLIGQQTPIDPDQYYLWHSTQNTNFTKYKNPRIDKLLEDGRKTLDFGARRSIYQDVQQYLVEDSIAIFLRHLVTYSVRRESL